MLQKLYATNKYNTDKGTDHSYIDHLYSSLFDHKYTSIYKVLEIGGLNGESIRLWRDYFLNAHIYCVDISNIQPLIQMERVSFIQGDAYSDNIKDILPNNFDIIIDDGPHTLDSMIYCIENYLNKINNNGILIIEDIQDEKWLSVLDSHINKSIFVTKIFDLRSIKNRYDDLVLTIEKKL